MDGYLWASERIKTLPPYIFSDFERKKVELQAKGVDVIDLGIGAPDLPTPDFVSDVLKEEAKKPENHRYSSYKGCREFRQAVSEFYEKRYGVKLDPETEVLTLIGSKEGIVHLIQAMINPGEKVIIPDPGYPVYQTAVHLAGGESIPLPLDARKGFVPQFERLKEADIRDAKLIFLNYPSNPTAATVELDTFKKAITFAGEHNIFLAHDAAYDLVTFNGYKAPSVMQVPGAKDIAVEFGSLSKSYNMTGWRIGYVVGNKEVVHLLTTLKSNVDTSQFLAIQKAAAAALKSDHSAVRQNNNILQKRMEKFYSALKDIGFQLEKPRGTIFLWVKVPDQYTSMTFTNFLLEKAGIIVTPGNVFGKGGEGYIRISLSVKEERIDEAIRRLKRLQF